MPRGDRTGPQGMGAMTGRGAGYCAGFNVPGYANRFPGGSAGMGFGGRGGHGRRNMFYATGVPGWLRFGSASAFNPPMGETVLSGEQELAALKNQSDYLKQALENIQKRIESLETK